MLLSYMLLLWLLLHAAASFANNNEHLQAPDNAAMSEELAEDDLDRQNATANKVCLDCT